MLDGGRFTTWALWQIENRKKFKTMIYALVSYQTNIRSNHSLIDDTSLVKSKIVAVKDLLEINDLFDHIVDVKVLI